jgi:hypothetical protein
MKTAFSTIQPPSRAKLLVAFFDHNSAGRSVKVLLELVAIPPQYQHSKQPDASSILGLAWLGLACHYFLDVCFKTLH